MWHAYACVSPFCLGTTQTRLLEALAPLSMALVSSFGCVSWHTKDSKVHNIQQLSNGRNTAKKEALQQDILQTLPITRNEFDDISTSTTALGRCKMLLCTFGILWGHCSYQNKWFSMTTKHINIMVSINSTLTPFHSISLRPPPSSDPLGGRELVPSFDCHSSIKCLTPFQGAT